MASLSTVRGADEVTAVAAARAAHDRVVREENPAILPWTPWLGAELRRGDPSAFVEAGRALSQYDARPFAHEVDVPTAVVLTMQDQLVGPAKQRVLAAAMRAHIVELAGDHLVNLADGERFAAAVRTGVDAVVAPALSRLIGSVEATSRRSTAVVSGRGAR